MSYMLNNEPLSQGDIVRSLSDQTRNGFVDGVVPIPLSSVIDHDLEGLLDILEYALVGHNVLSDMEYKVVGNGEHDTLHFRVAGFVQEID